MPEPATTTAPELTIVRTFNAPPALVFKAWTDPAHLVRWLGPSNFEAHDISLDVRPGGAWRACITSPEGNENWMSGTYREISPPDRLVFTFAWDSTGFQTLVTIDLEAQRDQTLMTFHQAPFASVESRDSHNGGWTESFDRLAALVAGSDAPN